MLSLGLNPVKPPLQDHTGWLYLAFRLRLQIAWDKPANTLVCNDPASVRAGVAQLLRARHRPASRQHAARVLTFALRLKRRV